MGKVKNWAWDTAENYFDELTTKVKNKTFTVAEAIAEAKTKDIMWSLIGINSFDELEEALSDN
tara:strand:+ start:86 stop:274 length:189 start_codon:yes stop_codon:yes gene_type:complete